MVDVRGSTMPVSSGVAASTPFPGEAEGSAINEDGNPGAMSGKENDTDARPSEDRGSLDVQSDLATDDGATSATGPLTQDVTPPTPVTAAAPGDKSDGRDDLERVEV